MDDLRRAYQRAVGVPLLNVEQLWREWDGYENGLNRVTVSLFKIEDNPRRRRSSQSSKFFCFKVKRLEQFENCLQMRTFLLLSLPFLKL